MRTASIQKSKVRLVAQKIWYEVSDTEVSFVS